jgi:hypothetical protein
VYLASALEQYSRELEQEYMQLSSQRVTTASNCLDVSSGCVLLDENAASKKEIVPKPVLEAASRKRAVPATEASAHLEPAWVQAAGSKPVKTMADLEQLRGIECNLGLLQMDHTIDWSRIEHDRRAGRRRNEEHTTQIHEEVSTKALMKIEQDRKYLRKKIRMDSALEDVERELRELRCRAG